MATTTRTLETPTPPPAAPLDPVTQYATDVVEGRIIASRLVRLQCQRHLTDLASSPANGLVWKPAEAQAVIHFFPAILRLPENTASDDDVEDVEQELLAHEGAPFVLQPWQQFIAGSLFGWYTAKGFRRFRIAYIETAKGSGKTPFCAGLLIYMTLCDGERGAQNYIAAVKLDQAQMSLADVESMVDASPALKRAFDIRTKHNLGVVKTKSFIRAISSEKRGLDGKRVHGAMIDELHEAAAIVVQKVRKGTKGRRNAMIFLPTNAGFDRESICWKYHDFSRQVLEGTLTNDAWFAFVCALDPCAKCLAAGKLQPSETCPACDDWKTEGPHWLKANPNLGVSLSWQYLRENVQEAVHIPSEQNVTKRLNFGIWTEQVTVWIPVDQWAACAAKVRLTLETMKGRECFIGVDLSDKIDLSSVVLIFPRPLERENEGPAENLQAGDAEGFGDDALEDVEVADDLIDRAIDVLPYFWMPEKSMRRRALEDSIPYPDWKQAGWLTTTPGELIDHDAIADFIIEAVAPVVHIRGIGVDQAGATAFVTRLQRHFGEELVTEVPQGFRMLSSPSKTLEALVISDNLAHDANPVMTWCIGNLAIEENKWGEIRPVKISMRKRIDGGVALIDAICTMQREPPGQGSAYADGHGLMVV